MMRAQLLAFAALMASLAASGQALAYCQTTSCLPSVSCHEDPEQCCILDRNGCDTNGLVVTWPSECTAYAIQAGDSPRRGLTHEDLSTAVDAAFGRWMAADCGSNTTPSIRFENFGPAECDQVEVNNGGPNANIWMYRDETWPHADLEEGSSSVSASALALTTVTFNWMTGELLDADVELNTAQGLFTVGDDDVNIDLDAIVTHEAGHFLGLDHTNDTTATMAPGYVPYTTDQRTLALDDERAICASYPEGRETSSQSCDPYGTYSPECAGSGCAIAGGPGAARSGAGTGFLALGAAGLLALTVYARRSRRDVQLVRARRRR